MKENKQTCSKQIIKHLKYLAKFKTVCAMPLTLHESLFECYFTKILERYLLRGHHKGF